MDIEEEADIYLADDQGNITEGDKDYQEESHVEGGDQDDGALEGDGCQSGGEEDRGYDDDNADDAYEIRDEEEEENTLLELSREAGSSENKSSEEKKDDNMLVVDEWDNEDMESINDEEETTEGSDVKALDPEDSERWLLNMPSMQTVMGDLLHLRRNRRLSVYPVTVDDLNSATVQAILASDKCEETKMQFIRPTSDLKKWTGFLALTFVTSKAATKAAEELKAIRDTLNVKSDSNPDQTLDHFIRDERKALAWPTFWADKLLLVRGVSADTKPEDLRAALFASAEEISVAKESPSTGPPHRRPPVSAAATTAHVAGYAYVLYDNAEEARSVAEEYTSKPPEFDDKLLDIKLYREPVGVLPKNLLSLRRRRVVLRHLDHLTRNLEKSRKDPAHKIAPWTEKRIIACKNVIEKDDKARADFKLQTPSLEDFKQMRGWRPFRPNESERILTSLGIMERKAKQTGGDQQQKSASSPKDGGDKAAAGRKRSLDERQKKRPPMGAGRGNFKRNRRGGRRGSPPGRRRDWSPPMDRSGRYMGRNRGGPSAGLEALGMMNPLALMMQQNLGGLVGGVNPALLNQMLLANPAAVAMIGGNSGQTAMPYMGGGGGRRGIDLEAPSKMLRLDESGTFRDRDYRSDRFDSHRDRGDDRGLYRDRGARHRSRTPEFLRNVPRGEGSGGRGGGGGGMRSYEGGPGNMRGDASGPRGYAEGGDGGGSGGPVREEDINMLMNLSKMLSQKMEQKRQQVEHGGYDRM